MKRLMALAGFILVLSSVGMAQFKKGDFEVSFSGSLGSWTADVSTTSNYGGSYNDNESRNYLFASVSPGYYIADGLSIEPELSLLAFEKSEPAEYVLINLSYTYPLAGSKVALYGRGGYGLSNAVLIPFMSSGLVGRTSEKFNVGVLNLGAGAKFVLTQSVVLRTEVNYRRHSWKESYDSYWSGSGSYDYAYSSVGLLIGFSILL